MRPVHFSQLNPRESSIKFFDKTYKLKPFTLSIRTWAYYEFQTPQEQNGVTVLSERLKDYNDIEAITKCIYKLMITRPCETYEEFMGMVESMGNKKILLWTVECYRALTETIGLSEPDIENIEEELELKKSEKQDQTA